MSFLPLFIDLSVGFVVLVGKGASALAKLDVLRARGARIRWYPMTGEVSAPADNFAVELFPGEPDSAALDNAVAVIVASGDEAGERLALIARERGIPVNVVDRPEISTFAFPAIVDRGEVVVAISTGGAAPVLARRLRERIEAILPERIGELAAFIGRWRKRLRARFGLSGSRHLWERFIDGPLGAGVLDGRSGAAEAWLASLKPDALKKPFAGSVVLVGAGPGDPDLLTLKALNALQNADVVFYDELVTPEIVARARRDSVKIPVGRRKGQPGPGHDAIVHRMIDTAKSGARVVRLKGGDPFVFGRGGEEVEALRAAGIPVAVVPGITAAVGAAAEWQIPLTYRGEASHFAIVTAQRAAGDDDTNWPELTDPATTLAVYMGLGSAGAIRDALIASGRDPATPSAVLARSTWPDSQALAGPLADLADLAARAGKGPALLIVGNVVARSKAWRQAWMRKRVLESA